MMAPTLVQKAYDYSAPGWPLWAWGIGSRDGMTLDFLHVTYTGAYERAPMPEVPLPAALPLMATAFVGLWMMRRSRA
jgi:hypothetical protein